MVALWFTIHVFLNLYLRNNTAFNEKNRVSLCAEARKCRMIRRGYPYLDIYYFGNRESRKLDNAMKRIDRVNKAKIIIFMEIRTSIELKNKIRRVLKRNIWVLSTLWIKGNHNGTKVYFRQIDFFFLQKFEKFKFCAILFQWFFILGQ